MVRFGAFVLGAGVSGFVLNCIVDFASGGLYVRGAANLTSFLFGVAAVYAINQNINSINEAHGGAMCDGESGS